MYTNGYYSIQIKDIYNKILTTQYMIITIYDDVADDITEGQLFRASVKTDKNETVVTLVSQEE